MLQYILANPSEVVAMILAGIGLSALLLHRNLIRKFMGLHVAVSALCLFMTAHCRATGLALPEGLLMTALASVSALTAIALALTLRLYRHYGVLDVDRLQAVGRGREQEHEQNLEHEIDRELSESEMAELWHEIEQLREEREAELSREHELERELLAEREREHELELEIQELRHEIEIEVEPDNDFNNLDDSSNNNGNNGSEEVRS